MFRSLALIAVTAVATFVGTRYFYSPRHDRAVEPISVVPNWIAPPCAPMESDEWSEEKLALEVLRTFKPPAWMHIGAMRQLGRERYRTIGKQAVVVCRSEEINAEIASVLIGQRMFSPSYLHADMIRLARRVGPRDPQIVEAVSRTAFHTHPIATQYPEAGQDIRSLARTMLAEFGTVPEVTRDRAFTEMSAKDALGTSAAQIAVAAGHPQALAKVSAMLDDILRAYRNDPIPHAARDRFYELAYALGAAGPAGAEHAAPVFRIMQRKVQSFAPPFGMISLPPRRMCRVLELMGGPAAEQATVGEVCHPQIDVYER